MSYARAWTYTDRGDPAQVLQLETDRPVPTLPPTLPLPKAAPKPEEWLLVKVSYAGLNFGGYFAIAKLPAKFRAKTAVPEMDLSGTVLDVWHPDSSSPATKSELSNSAAVAETAPRFRKGDRISAFLPVGFTFATGSGALSSHVAFPAKYAIRTPDTVLQRDAAGLLLAGGVALAQVEAAKLKQGGRVLVNGASGGIGTMALQMARHIVGPEGHIVAVCSGKNAKMVLSLGADEVIDYTQYTPLSKELASRFGSQPFDAVLDSIGIQELFVNSASYLVPEGIYSAVGIKPASHANISYVKIVINMLLNGVWPRSRWLGGTGRTWNCVTLFDMSVERMEEIMSWVESGKIKIVVDRVLGFEDVLEGYDIIGKARAAGKIIIKVDDEVD